LFDEKETNTNINASSLLGNMNQSAGYVNYGKTPSNVWVDYKPLKKDLNATLDEKEICSIVNQSGIYGGHYDKCFYVEGDYLASHRIAQWEMENGAIGSYSAVVRNCAQKCVDILIPSIKNTWINIQLNFVKELIIPSLIHEGDRKVLKKNT